MNSKSEMGAGSKALLALDVAPWDIAYRAIVGFGLMPAYALLGGDLRDTWRLLGFLLVVLAAMRVVPGLLRRVLPFSRDLKEVWADRRALAKRYDSFQWRKLLGIGLGWAAYLWAWGAASGAPLRISLACVAAGAAGSLFWRQHSRAMAQAAGAKPSVSAAPAG